MVRPANRCCARNAGKSDSSAEYLPLSVNRCLGPKLPRSSITGYMGHVTYIANKLVDASERSLFISQQLDASPAWADFAAGALQV